MEHEQNDDLDKLLKSLKSQYKATDTSDMSEKLPKQQNNIGDLLDQIKSERKINSTIKEKSDLLKSNNIQIGNDLDSIKAQYQDRQHQQKAQEELSFKRNKQEIIIQEQQKQLQRKELMRQAEKWLLNLDPFSDEGMWFSQLAESYPSKLDAAIHYLSILKKFNS